MTFTVTAPDRMNSAFADAFNSRDIANLLRLYEPDAVLRTDDENSDVVGLPAIASALEPLMRLPGRMVSRNHFCLMHGSLALLRADWELLSEVGAIIASGSSAELVRKQADGRWLYAIDHAVGASRPRLAQASFR